jgi:hypothetical protein
MSRSDFVIIPILSQFGNNAEPNLPHPYNFVGDQSDIFTFKVNGDINRNEENCFMIINSYNVRDDRHQIFLNDKPLRMTHGEPVFDASEGVRFGDIGPLPSARYNSRIYIIHRDFLNDKEHLDTNTNKKGINSLRIERTLADPDENHGLGKNDNFRISFITIFWKEDTS